MGAETISRLSVDRDLRVRLAALANPNCSPEALVMVYGIVQYSALDAAMKAVVARHRRCPKRLLRDLAGDESQRVRAAVAGNPRCPKPTLAALRTGPIEKVRFAAAFNLGDLYV